MRVKYRFNSYLPPAHLIQGWIRVLNCIKIQEGEVRQIFKIGPFNIEYPYTEIIILIKVLAYPKKVYICNYKIIRSWKISKFKYTHFHNPHCREADNWFAVLLRGVIYF